MREQLYKGRHVPRCRIQSKLDELANGNPGGGCLEFKTLRGTSSVKQKMAFDP